MIGGFQDNPNAFENEGNVDEPQESSERTEDSDNNDNNNDNENNNENDNDNENSNDNHDNNTDNNNENSNNDDNDNHDDGNDNENDDNDNDNNDDNNDSDNDDGDNNDGPPFEDTQTIFRLGKMKFKVEQATQDLSVRKYAAWLFPSVPNCSDYSRIFMSLVFPTLVLFYTYLMTISTNGFQLWGQYDLTFEKDTNDDQQPEVVLIPIRVRRVMVLDENQDTLRDLVTGQISDILSRLIDILSMGSGFRFRSLERVFYHVSFNVNALFNNIGYDRIRPETETRRRRLFGSRADKHLNSRGAPILSRHILSICSNSDDCFLMSLGAYVEGLTRAAISSMPQTDEMYARLRHRLAQAARRTFNLQGCESFPTSLHQISLFQRQNKEYALNIYGLSLKDNNRAPRNRYNVFPVKISDKNDVATIPKINLLITHREPSGFYHLNLILSYDNLLRNGVNYGTQHKYGCYKCCSTHATQLDRDNHQSGCDEDRPRLIYPAKSEREVFQKKKKSQITYRIAAGDFETTLSHSDDTLGDMTKNHGKFQAVLGGYVIKWLIHTDLFPTSLPKFIGGPTACDKLWKFLRFDCLFTTSSINQTYYPVRPLTDQEKIHIQSANSCANCGIFLGQHGLRNNRGRAVLHHCHR